MERDIMCLEPHVMVVVMYCLRHITTAVDFHPVVSIPHVTSVRRSYENRIRLGRHP